MGYPDYSHHDPTRPDSDGVASPDFVSAMFGSNLVSSAGPQPAVVRVVPGSSVGGAQPSSVPGVSAPDEEQFDYLDLDADSVLATDVADDIEVAEAEEDVPVPAPRPLAPIAAAPVRERPRAHQLPLPVPPGAGLGYGMLEAPVADPTVEVPALDPAPLRVDALPGSGELDRMLARVGFGEKARAALLRQQRDPEAAAALTRLALLALVAAEGSQSDRTAGEHLRAELAAARGEEVTGHAVRFLHGDSEHAVLTRLLTEMRRLQVIDSPLELVNGSGNPRPLGRVSAVGLLWYREVPGVVRTSAQRFLQTILHPSGGGGAVVVGNYVVFAMDVHWRGAIETVHVLAPVYAKGERLICDLPAAAAETRHRLVQGLVEGLWTERNEQVVDQLTFTPLVLSRGVVVPARGAPADSRMLRERLGEAGATSAAVWYLEPSWMALASTRVGVQPLEPETSVGTPEFDAWVDRIRDEARERRKRDATLPKQRLLRLLQGLDEAKSR